MEKVIIIDTRAQRELKKFPRSVQIKFRALFHVLKTDGKLIEPYGKKLIGFLDLYEIRVKHHGQWRVLYTYQLKDYIIVLSAFVKKTQKTPKRELTRARNRLKEYKEVI